MSGIPLRIAEPSGRYRRDLRRFTFSNRSDPCLGVALAVARLRTGRRHPCLETLGVLATVLAVAAGCALAFPGAAAG